MHFKSNAASSFIAGPGFIYYFSFGCTILIAMRGETAAKESESKVK
jgi:Na+/pantothenate symporter